MVSLMLSRDSPLNETNGILKSKVLLLFLQTKIKQKEVIGG